MSGFQQKITGQAKCQKSQSRKTKKTSELSWDMTQMLEWSDREFKIRLIYKGRVWNMEKNNMQEEMDIVSGET